MTRENKHRQVMRQNGIGHTARLAEHITMLSSVVADDFADPFLLNTWVPKVIKLLVMFHFVLTRPAADRLLKT